MNLNTLIKQYGSVTNVKNSWGKIHRKLNSGSKIKLEEMVCDWFKSLGWDSKSNADKDGFISRKKKHHTKIDWQIHEGYYDNPYGRAKLFQKTPNGGWAVAEYNNVDIGALVVAANAIDAPTLITKNSLPPAIFIGLKKNISIVNQSATTYNKWKAVYTKGVVGLENDGTISKQEVFKPDEQPWFHVMVKSHDGSAANIITDGEILHPVKARGKMRVTSNIPEIVEDTTVLDKELLTLAIGTLFRNE